MLLGALWVLQQWGRTLPNQTLYDIAREGVLALLAVVVIRAVLQFVAGVLLARFTSRARSSTSCSGSH